MSEESECIAKCTRDIDIREQMSFTFQKFHIEDRHCGMKVSTDSVLIGSWSGGGCECSDVVAGVLDVGAGSGVVALMMAQRFASAVVDAVEVDADACADAVKNVAASQWAYRVRVHNAEFNKFADTCPGPAYDLIVSNPPFFTSELRSPDMARASARHVAGTCDSELSYNTLIANSSKLLKKNGLLAMVLPADAESDMIFAAEMARMKVRRLCRVHTVAGKRAVRIMCELSFADGPMHMETLTLRNADGTPTIAYKQLAANFYLK